MKLSIMEIVLLLDTLNGSLSIVDRHNLFRFTEEQRKTEKEKLEKYLNNITINVNEENIGG